MKKLLFTAAIAVMSFATTQAQEFKFGAKAGLNVATIGGDLGTGDFSYDSRLSFHVGGLAEISLSEKFALQPELLYSSQGAKATDNYTRSVSIGPGTFFNASVKEESTLKLGYIVLPIMAKFMPFEGFSIEAGPQVGFLISADEDYEETVTVQGVTESESGSEDIKDEFKSIDLALNFGLGYKLENGLMFQARYNFGLSDLDEDDEDEIDIANVFAPKTRNFQLSVGYMF